MLKLACASVVALSALCGVSHADDLAVHANAPQKDPSVAISISPLHLFIATVELTTEVRVAPKVGIAAITGVGSLKLDTPNADRATVFEGGLSARYYVAGSFRSGLQLGTEALYVYAMTNASMVDVSAAGLAVSPFVGYKWTGSSGITLEAQAGGSYMVVRAHATTGEMAGRNAWGPLLNLQLGYSF